MGGYSLPRRRGLMKCEPYNIGRPNRQCTVQNWLLLEDC